MKDFFEHIDDYMDGNLSSSDRAAFEVEMDNNLELKTAVQNYHDAKKLSEGLLEADMMETLNKLRAEEEEGEKMRGGVKKERGFNRKLVLVFGLLGLIALSWWFMNSNKSKLNKEEVLANYERPIDQDITRSNDTIGMDFFQKGKHFFILNKFNESEQWLNKATQQEKDKKKLSQVYYWLGSAHIEQWEVKEAKRAWSESEEEEAKRNLVILK